MTRRIVLLLLCARLAAAQDSTAQIDWVGDWDAAFAQARKSDRPVMVCINSKDEEQANRRAATGIYRDAGFVELTRRFVMVVVSTRSHRATGPCTRFGRVTCKQHLDCWKSLRAGYGDQFLVDGQMISPQHAWFRPDGTLLRRKEYELTKPELLQRMRRVLAELAGKELPPEEGDAGGPAADIHAPLTEKERAELARVAGGDEEERAAAIANLLATEKVAAQAALVELLQATKKVDLRCALLHGLGRARVAEARFAIEEQFKHKNPLVRSFAAVALEQLAARESIEALLKRVRSERDTQARKNAYRALGACGGGCADKRAAKAILKGIRSDKQNAVKKHAAIALRAYEGPGAPLVLPKLEKIAQKVKDNAVRGGVVYTLAYIGSRETTLPVLEELRDGSNVEYVKRFLRSAIAILKGNGDWGRATWFLFSEDRADPARKE